MKWPFVSRDRYDSDIKSWIQSADLWEQRFDEERARSDKLVAQMLTMKQQGYDTPSPVTPREAKEIDPLKQAVLNASIGKPPSVRAAMLKQLAEDVKSVEAGLMTAMDVQRRIETGFTADDVGLPE